MLKVQQFAIVVLCVGAALTGVCAADPLVASFDTWVDASRAPSGKVYQRLLQAECSLMLDPALVARKDGGYDVLLEPRQNKRLGLDSAQTPYCVGSKFYGLPRAVGSFSGRSGFLVAPDLVLTAAHDIPASATDVPWKVVFGFNDSQVGGDRSSRLQSNRFSLSRDDVYDVVEIVSNGLSLNPPRDLLLLRLDRQVTGRQPVRIRREGTGFRDDRLVAVGHPDQLMTKVDHAGSYWAANSQSNDLVVTGVHSLVGSSGSMIYNTDRDCVEGLIVTLGAAQESVTPQSCWTTTHRGTPTATGELIAPFVAFVPPISAVVSPLTPFRHQAPVGGNVTDSVTYVSIESPHGPRVTPSVAVSFEYTTSGDVPLAPGAGVPFVKADIERSENGDNRLRLRMEIMPNGAMAGVYRATVLVTDTETGYFDTIVHDIEIGQTDLDVLPLEPFDIAQMAGSVEAMKWYSVSATTPVPTTVEVRTLADWITLDGVEAPAGGSVRRVISLNGNLDPEHSASFVLGVSRRVEGLTPQVLRSAVIVDNLDNSGNGHGDREIPCSLTWGLGTYKSGPDFGGPLPDGGAEGLSIPLEVRDDFCVDALSISVGPFGPVDSTSLRFTLTSPSGTSQVILEGQVLPEEEPYTITGASLEPFRDQPARGTWRLNVADLVTDGSRIYFGAWGMEARSGGTPPCP